MMFLRCLLLSCCAWLLQAAVTVELLPQAQIAGDVARIGDIARCQGPEEDLIRLQALEVQLLPDAGERSVDAQRVQALINRGLPGLRATVTGECSMRRATSDFSPDDFSAVARAELLARLGQLEADAQLLVQRPAQALSLPMDREHPYTLLAEPLCMNDWGEIPYRVRIMQGQRERQRVLLVLRLERYRDQLVCARDLPRAHRLSTADIHLRRVVIRDMSTAAAPSVSEALGCLTRAPLQAGQPITANLIERPPMVHGGSAVQLTVETDRFRLAVSGVALGDGREGEVISVRPAGDRRILRGRVVAPGRVLVERP